MAQEACSVDRDLNKDIQGLLYRGHTASMTVFSQIRRSYKFVIVYLKRSTGITKALCDDINQNDQLCIIIAFTDILLTDQC